MPGTRHDLRRRPLKSPSRLTIYDKDPDTGAKNIPRFKEQEVFFGDFR